MSTLKLCRHGKISGSVLQLSVVIFFVVFFSQSMKTTRNTIGEVKEMGALEDSMGNLFSFINKIIAF